MTGIYRMPEGKRAWAAPLPETAPRYDAVVVGGGTAGAISALVLAERGCKTLIVERLNCLGGTSTAGGSGRILGTVIGALILASISSAITYLGISTNWADFIKGAIILISVLVSALRTVKRKRSIPGKAGVQAS